MNNNSDSRENNSSSISEGNADQPVKMPIRDGRSGKPGSSGGSSSTDSGWSKEAMRAGTGGPESKSDHEGIEPHSGEPSGQTETAREKDKNGLV